MHCTCIRQWADTPDAGLLWISQNAHQIGGDKDSLLAAGVGAGGGLAAGLALLARDRVGPHLTGWLLVCPMLDDRNDSPSARQFVGVGVWDAISNATAWEALLGAECGTDSVSPYAAPARATDLSGLPSAFIDCPPRPSATRASTTPLACGPRACRQNCTSGPVPSTASTRSSPTRPSPLRRDGPVSTGCGA